MTFTLARPQITPNVDLLWKTLAQVEEQPDLWRQTAFAVALAQLFPGRCGTAHCFGGWAIILHGNTLNADNPGIVTPLPGDHIDPAVTWDLVGGRTVMDTWAYAQHILGLTADQAGDLFNIRNTLDDLRRIVAELCGEAS